MMKTKDVKININDTDQVSGVLTIPDGYPTEDGCGAIFAHGAANDMNNPLIVACAEGMAKQGCLTLRFNFHYREMGKKSPDSQKKLEKTWSSAFQYFKNDCGYKPSEIIAVGKSLGGRIASQMVALEMLPADKLIFLGYPLHAPGKKEKLRDAHLYDIDIPMLFFAGTRDPFADLSLLKDVISRLSSSELETIDGGDHSFNLPKSSDVSQKEVYEHMLRRITDWIKLK